MEDTENTKLAAGVGQEKPVKDVVDAHDSGHGKYVDAVEKVETEQRLPTVQMPKGPDPLPFTLGPSAAGGR